VEELSRPGQHYVVSRTGALTFHGKAFAPEETPIGSAHSDNTAEWGVQGQFKVNEGQLSPAMEPIPA
jgi:hypothetical protein